MSTFRVKAVGNKLIYGKRLTDTERTWLATVLLRTTEAVTTDSISERTAMIKCLRELLNQEVEA